jgi:hypothetical protein
MSRTLARSAIVAVVLAGAAIAGTGSQAQARPMFPVGTEFVFTYYSNAQHTGADIGQRYVGTCGLSYLNWGKTSSYDTYTSFSCSS